MIYGIVFCEGNCLLVYMEDVGCYNVVDKIVGWMFEMGIFVDNKLFYIIGCLILEMVIKCVFMGIFVLVSCFGFMVWGVEIV